jgi:hypothetical protein
VNRDDRLLAYSAISGRLWVFDQGKLTGASWLWPKRALEDFRERNLNIHRGYFPLFQSLVLDGDNANRFLLNYGSFREGDENYLYQFDISGKLIRVFCVPNPERSFVRVYFKRNGQFYAIQRNQFENLTIAVYREGQHE